MTDALKPLMGHGTLKQQMEEKTPMQRLGTPEEIAWGALYLCSPAVASITSKMLEIDGGQSTINWPLPMNHFARQA